DPVLAEAEVMGAVFGSVMGAPPLPLLIEGIKTLVEEAEAEIELDESDLIFEPEPIFTSSVSGPRDLTHLFDFSVAESFDGWALDSAPTFSESDAVPFRPEEEAWFIDPESLALQNFPPTGSEALPQARTVSPRPKTFISSVGDVFRGLWNAWKSET